MQESRQYSLSQNAKNLNGEIMSTFLYLLLTLFLLSIMIVIHEFGHFLFAKLFKVTVLEFSIGMGPAIFTTGRKKKKKQQDKNLIGNTFY